MKKSYFEIRTRDEKIDDIALDTVDIHLERMDNNTWWLGVYRAGGVARLAFNICSKSKIDVKISEQGLPVKWIEQNTHVLIKE